MIINVKVRNASIRKSDNFDSETTTPRQAFDALDVPFSAGNVTFNGTPLTAAQVDLPFSQLPDCREESLLASVVKADGGCC